jgi:hypothetical protein
MKGKGSKPNFLTRTMKERFWEKVDKNGPVILSEPCWIWTGSLNEWGYGRFFTEGSTRVYAHRFSFELHHGALPKGLKALHHCDNSTCVNPHHLYAGTDQDNRRDALRRGRQPTAKLTLAQVREIRALHKQGIAAKSLAILVKLHATTVRSVIRNKTWRVLDEPAMACERADTSAVTEGKVKE